MYTHILQPEYTLLMTALFLNKNTNSLNEFNNDTVSFKLITKNALNDSENNKKILKILFHQIFHLKLLLRKYKW